MTISFSLSSLLFDPSLLRYYYISLISVIHLPSSLILYPSLLSLLPQGHVRSPSRQSLFFLSLSLVPFMVHLGTGSYWGTPPPPLFHSISRQRCSHRPRVPHRSCNKTHTHTHFFMHTHTHTHTHANSNAHYSYKCFLSAALWWRLSSVFDPPRSRRQKNIHPQYGASYRTITSSLI